MVEHPLMVDWIIGLIPHGGPDHRIDPSWCTGSSDRSLMVDLIIGSIPHGGPDHRIDPSWWT